MQQFKTRNRRLAIKNLKYREHTSVRRSFSCKCLNKTCNKAETFFRNFNNFHQDFFRTSQILNIWKIILHESSFFSFSFFKWWGWGGGEWEKGGEKLLKTPLEARIISDIHNINKWLIQCSIPFNTIHQIN